MPRRRHGLPGGGLRQRGAGGGRGGRGGRVRAVRGVSLPPSPHRLPTTPTRTPTTMICTRVSVRAPRAPRACFRPAGSAGPGRAVPCRGCLADSPSLLLPHCFSFPAGDPKQDLAYERQYEQQTYQVIPEVIKNFIQYFHKTVSDLIDQKVYELQASRVSSDVIDQKVYEIQDIYENRYSTVLPVDGGHCFNCDAVKGEG